MTQAPYSPQCSGQSSDNMDTDLPSTDWKQPLAHAIYLVPYHELELTSLSLTCLFPLPSPSSLSPSHQRRDTIGPRFNGSNPNR